MVTATVKDDLLGDCLVLPRSIVDKIKEKTSTTAEFRDNIIKYFITYIPCFTWSELCGILYYKEQLQAVAAAKKFINTTSGKLGRHS